MTAVEWLTEQFGTFEFMYCDRSRIIKIAKEMEKEQIIDSYIECKRQYVIQESCFPPQFVIKEAEQYYNETFKNK